MNNQNDHDLYTIPPNFIGSSTFLGGLFKVRNVIEAGILAVVIGVPVIFLLPFGVTAKVVILCLTALPAALFALMGIGGESLSSFLIVFVKYLKNRRVVTDVAPEKRKRKVFSVKRAKSKKSETAEEDTAAEEQPSTINLVSEYIPVTKIENGIVYTKDHRYVKILEVIPINFLLRSGREQRNIIYSFVSYLKICPVRVQFKVLTRRADINLHMQTVRKEMETETNEHCRLMQEDYLQFVQQISSREAVTRRFFLIFEYEPWSNTRRSEESDAITAIQTAVHTASNYLRQCGNKVVVPDNENEFVVDVLYNLLCRNESAVKPLPIRVKEIAAQRFVKGMSIEDIPVGEFFSPHNIDFMHGRYICISHCRKPNQVVREYPVSSGLFWDKRIIGFHTEDTILVHRVMEDFAVKGTFNFHWRTPSEQTP